MSTNIAIQLYRAYETLVLRHRKIIWWLCWRHSHGDIERCRDLVQDVSATLWKRLDRLRTNATPLEEEAWVVMTTRSVLYNLERDEAARQVPTEQLSLAVELAEEQHHCREQLVELMSYLTPQERALLQRELDGYRQHEIAAELGVSVSTVSRRRDKILAKLREISKTIY